MQRYFDVIRTFLKFFRLAPRHSVSRSSPQRQPRLSPRCIFVRPQRNAIAAGAVRYASPVFSFVRAIYRYCTKRNSNIIVVIIKTNVDGRTRAVIVKQYYYHQLLPTVVAPDRQRGISYRLVRVSRRNTTSAYYYYYYY